MLAFSLAIKHNLPIPESETLVSAIRIDSKEDLQATVDRGSQAATTGEHPRVAGVSKGSSKCTLLSLSLSLSPPFSVV